MELKAIKLSQALNELRVTFDKDYMGKWYCKGCGCDQSCGSPLNSKALIYMFLAFGVECANRMWRRARKSGCRRQASAQSPNMAFHPDDPTLSPFSAVARRLWRAVSESLEHASLENVFTADTTTKLHSELGGHDRSYTVRR